MKNLYKIKTCDIAVNRTISAKPAEVFDAWLDPQHVGSPWNGVKHAIVQPYVDGFFYRMHMSGNSPKGEEYELAHYGRFTILERPKKIQYTWVSQHTRGLETVVTLELTAQGERTIVSLRHEGVPDDEKGHMHKLGWTHYLNAIAEHEGK